MSVFDKRVAFKPFEYPEILEYKNAINHSYWLVSEWNFIGDVHDFNVKLNDVEKNAIKNAMLAISQIEVSVKKFWTKLGDRFPKAEFDQIGVTFGESEVRHSDAYSHLLQVLGFNDDFASLLENPVILGRVDYLTKYLQGASDKSNENYTLTLTLFSIFIENVSLFSQFLIIKSFNKHMNILKDIDNVVQATQKEELVHALFGVALIDIIKKEYPDWFNAAFYEKLYKACEKAYDAECNIIDWIFEQGELSFLSKAVVKEFIKNRFNESVEMVGGEKVFEVDDEKLSEIQWFNDEIYAEVNTDFFHKKPVTYSKKVQAIKAEDIF
ncbi:MAG: ribonucleotide reductase [Candidatus Dadabacteria bacterium]|nr:ribonucleotide reductase [Candidatus Dadabacteria bacterium]